MSTPRCIRWFTAAVIGGAFMLAMPAAAEAGHYSYTSTYSGYKSHSYSSTTVSYARPGVQVSVSVGTTRPAPRQVICEPPRPRPVAVRSAGHHRSTAVRVSTRPSPRASYRAGYRDGFGDGYRAGARDSRRAHHRSRPSHHRGFARR